MEGLTNLPESVACQRRFTTESAVTLIYELVHPRTAAELALYADLGRATVLKVLNGLRARKLVHIADWQWSLQQKRYVPKYCLDLTGRKKDVPQPRV
jgi:hypothetical protein